ncbi:centrosomal protein POC5 [Corythoichthys intestinalis]|uniref:centrosomal protein POC5 n=1 Tax=Corythoichthys intestinalis TaxID=161448 RepID=UPI0025A65F8B|nr:centrosomal protein POC5 [Corythoichthys intestinalis]XP_057687247.1 centrosomal protein POC5 [Corythoichthys intestinalis]XP_057687248.1 centrosomal protein POC5 [Corythoichthys intestinalis]XP_057687249.1 centrosomal protein POC5 [Corythoichthys intestinalis]XP_057687250.1 centrosomal protein POC5 [Corythoichthys intestinalis]
MSSDEEASVPVLPPDSTYRSNSPSTELQDEYEDLLQSAVASPRFDAASAARLRGIGASSDEQSSRRDSQIADPDVEGSSYLRTHHEKARHSTSRGLGSTDRLQDASERGQQSKQVVTETELFISEDHIGKIENILDTWNQKLKTNILRELRKWRVAFIEQHRRELQKEREFFISQTEAFKSKIDNLKDLLKASENSNRKKDEMISNLSAVMDRQRQKIDKMRTFTHWRIQYIEAKEDAQSCRVAQQHFNLRLKKKVWLAWYHLIKKEWKDRMEEACRKRAEEVCTHLSENYETQIKAVAAEYSESLETAQAEVKRLQLERDRREVCMRKALMRGVCALNMETLHLFNTPDGEPQDSDGHENNSSPDDDPDAAALASTQPRPPPFDGPGSASHHENGDRMGGHHRTGHSGGGRGGAGHPVAKHPGPGYHGAGQSAATHSSFQHGSETSFQKQGFGVIAIQQKTKHVAKSSVTPPMTSTSLEFHHAVPQQTHGQATASKFLQSSQQAPHTTGGWAPSRMHPSTYPSQAWDEPRISTFEQHPVGSPGFDHPQSCTHHEESRLGVWYTSEVFPSTSAGHSAFPQGGSSSFHKQTSGRVVTAGQQKAEKTVKARITAQPFIGKSIRNNQSMGAAAPMTTIVIQRHQPITEHTIGQVSTAKGPRPSQQAPRTPTVVKTSAKTNANTSIKVVD